MGIPQSEGRVLMPHPTVAQIRAGLEGWQARHPDRLQVTVPAQSVGGRDVLLARVTDQSVSDDHKQVVLLTCTHAGRWEVTTGAPAGQVEPFDKLLARMEGSAQFDLPAIREFMATVPVTHYMAFGGPMGLPERRAPIERGLGVRLQVPHADARVTRVLLDGKPLGEGWVDGWVAWGDLGTTVQVNLPPGAVRDFHLIQLRYDADDSARPCGWTQDDWQV